MALEKQPAYYTHERIHEDGGHLYYFAPTNRHAPPYKTQIETTAILDVAADGTLAGVELVFGDLPPPPFYAYPPDGGLKEQVRSYDETKGIGAMFRRLLSR